MRLATLQQSPFPLLGSLRQLVDWCQCMVAWPPQCLWERLPHRQPHHACSLSRRAWAPRARARSARRPGRPAPPPGLLGLPLGVLLGVPLGELLGELLGGPQQRLPELLRAALPARMRLASLEPVAGRGNI